jgi:hypothetical protein
MQSLPPEETEACFLVSPLLARRADGNKRRVFWPSGWALVGVVLCLGGCGGFTEPPSPPGGGDIVRRFDPDSAPVYQRAATAEPQRKIFLYVDSSVSMKGFVAQPPSNYWRALNFVMDRISTARYDLKVHEFSDRVSKLENRSAASILSPSFYSGQETAFPLLFEHIARETQPEDIAIVVSDFVQSGRTGDQRALVTAFQKLTPKKPAILLLAFRSAFQGTYYVEGRRIIGPTIHLSLDGRAPDRARPFYVLLIAGSASGLEEARNLLLPDIGADEEFAVSKPALALATAEFLPPNSGEFPVWNAYRPVEKLPLKSDISVEALSFLEISPPIAEPTRLRLQFQCAGECAASPLRAPERLHFEITRSSQKQGKWSAVEAVGSPAHALFSADRKHLSVEYSVRRPEALSWDVYRARILPGMANLRAPLWVDEWTTSEDGTVRLGHRTFKLDLFVEAMIRSIQEQIPISEHYLLLGRGE